MVSQHPGCCKQPASGEAILGELREMVSRWPTWRNRIQRTLRLKGF